MSTYDPTVGDEVTVRLDGMPQQAKVVELVSVNTVGIRITDPDSFYLGQTMFVNAAELTRKGER